MKMENNVVKKMCRVKKQIMHTMNDLRRNNLEISVRFSWPDLIIVFIGLCTVMMSFKWIGKIKNKICVHREAKKLAKEAEQQ